MVAGAAGVGVGVQPQPSEPGVLVVLAVSSHPKQCQLHYWVPPSRLLSGLVGLAGQQ